jgi:ring-1,2-phenylacetyl-CoA epoxidase subunit PaaE
LFAASPPDIFDTVSTAAAEVVDRIDRIPDPQEPIPPIALPTLALFAGGLALWGASTALGATGTWPWPLSVLLNAAASFVLFTVSHDAAHNAVSTSGGVTTWMGRVATVMFAPHAGFRTWRFIHMQHHRFTNADDGRDPDHYTHDAPRWQLPLRWLTVDLYYMVFYLPQLKTRPRAERVELVATWIVVGAVIIAAAVTGHLLALLVFYFVPIRLAVGLLAWSFDYLPHHGLEEHTAQSNRFRATRNRVGREWLMSPLLLNQNYHLVHHLHPVIPFYRYVRVWRRREDDYLARDPALSDVRGRPLTADEYRRLRAMAVEHRR